MLTLLKLLLVPLLIALVTLAGRRFGPAVAGWLSAFPVISGPILLFIALDQGAVFAAQAAAATLTAVLAILVFGISYAWLALRHTWPLSVCGALLSYFAAVMMLNIWRPELVWAALAVITALLIAPRLYPDPASSSAAQHPTPALRAPNDLYWRMLAGGALVILVTQFSSALGPRLSGLLAMFPVMGTVLAVFTQRQSGTPATIALLRGMVLGFYAFASFCIVLAVCLTQPWARLDLVFGLALTAALLVQLATRWWVVRTENAAE